MSLTMPFALGSHAVSVPFGINCSKILSQCLADVDEVTPNIDGAPAHSKGMNGGSTAGVWIPASKRPISVDRGKSAPCRAAYRGEDSAGVNYTPVYSKGINITVRIRIPR